MYRYVEVRPWIFQYRQKREDLMNKYVAVEPYSRFSNTDRKQKNRQTYKRYTHKTLGFKTSGFKTSGFKTSETSGLQNIRFTKSQVYKMSGLQNVRFSKHPVEKKHPFISCTCGWWKSAGSVAAMFAGKVMAVFYSLF